MISEGALVGMRVRVRESLTRADLRGIEGTIARRWGSPHYVALDVLLDDGRTQLFWHHKLEDINTIRACANRRVAYVSRSSRKAVESL
jgi:hypothetical protein